MKMQVHHTPQDFREAYIRAPHGSPDKFVTTLEVVFTWENVPERKYRVPFGRFSVPHPYNPAIRVTFIHHRRADGTRYFRLELPAPYYFAVTAAPSFPAALPGACLHDVLYDVSRYLANLLGLSLENYLDLADKWFHLQLKASEFILARLYYRAVSILGYPFHLLGRLFGASKTKDTPPPD